MSPLESFKVPEYPKKEAAPNAPNQPGNKGTYVLTLHPIIVPINTTPIKEFHILKSTACLSSGSYTCFHGLSEGGNCFLLDSSIADFACDRRYEYNIMREYLLLSLLLYERIKVKYAQIVM